MKFQIEHGALILDGRKVELPLPAYDVVEFGGRILVALDDGDTSNEEKERHGNIVGLDREGRMLWRIGPTHMRTKMSNGAVIVEGWQGFRHDPKRPGALLVADPIGYVWDLDPETGAVSNPVFVK